MELRKIILSIAKSISQIIPDFNIYTNSSSQNAEMPALFVNVGETCIESELSGIRKITANININAIISDRPRTEEKYEIMSRILTKLEYINYGDKKIRVLSKKIAPDNDGRVIMTAKIIFRLDGEKADEIMQKLYDKTFIKIELRR